NNCTLLELYISPLGIIIYFGYEPGSGLHFEFFAFLYTFIIKVKFICPNSKIKRLSVDISVLPGFRESRNEIIMRRNILYIVINIHCDKYAMCELCDARIIHCDNYALRESHIVIIIN